MGKNSSSLDASSLSWRSATQPGPRRGVSCTQRKQAGTDPEVSPRLPKRSTDLTGLRNGAVTRGMASRRSTHRRYRDGSSRKPTAETLRLDGGHLFMKVQLQTVLTPRHPKRATSPPSPALVPLGSRPVIFPREAVSRLVRTGGRCETD